MLLSSFPSFVKLLRHIPLHPARVMQWSVTDILFQQGGDFVAEVKGCNAPLLHKTIVDMLEMEHKVLRGEAKRRVVRVVAKQRMCVVRKRVVNLLLCKIMRRQIR